MVRAAIAVAGLVILVSGTGLAQSPPAHRPSSETSGSSGAQPQGHPGPVETKQQGGAPASSPQGETPPGMQSAPQGADKPVRTDSAGVPEGSPKR